MREFKKTAAGLLALMMTASLAACSPDTTDGDQTSDTASVTTTTAKTVAVNTEGLKDGEEDVLENAMTQLRDVELENKEIKWLAHYDINPSGTGASKSVGLEMFERKYGGKVVYYETPWESRYSDLSTYVLGGEGIDFFPGEDPANFPKCIVSGMFQPVDNYIDLNSAIWQNTKDVMELYNFGGKHFELITDVASENVVVYNKATIEANGLDDPWELYEAGEWNWDTFKEMLVEFVDEENDQWGLDGYWSEKALYLSAGVPTVESVDGKLVCNLNDSTVEKAMNYQYDLFNSGLVFPREQFEWKEHPEMMGDGRQLFYIAGVYTVMGDPEVWTTQIPPEDLGIAPVPSPVGSDPYQSAKLNGYAICKGASNPEGVALLAECFVVAAADEGAMAIADRKSMDDNQWSEEITAINREINELTRKYPVVDLAPGCSTDIASYTTDGGDNVGTRAALHGTDWSTTRETIAEAIINLVAEVDTQLQAKVAELS